MGVLGYLSLYRCLVSARIRSQMQYRVSFVLEVLGNFFITVLDFVTIAILLTRFRQVGGWTIAEVAFLYGVSGISFSLAQTVGRGFDVFHLQIVRGDFDRVLIRPLGTFFHLVASDFGLRQLGRFIQAALVLFLAERWLGVAWTLPKLLFLMLTLASGALFFLGIMVVGATFCFWTAETAEVTNIFTHGGTYMLQYPMHIYQEWFRNIFIFIVPMAFINYFPALYLLDKADPLGLPGFFPFLSPLISLGIFLLARAFWHFGVRHYQSTGT